MDRLTFRSEGILKLRKTFPTLKDTIDILACRLEIYEDTGMAPDEIIELKQIFSDLADGISPPYKNRDLILELKNLRAELASVKLQRDAAIADITGHCSVCKGCENREKIEFIHGGCAAWKWRGLHEED